MKEVGTDIYEAVHSGRLTQPFSASSVREACPHWMRRTPSTFLAKHAVDNPGKNSELFVRVARGLYRLI